MPDNDGLSKTYQPQQHHSNTQAAPTRCHGRRRGSKSLRAQILSNDFDQAKPKLHDLSAKRDALAQRYWCIPPVVRSSPSVSDEHEADCRGTFELVKAESLIDILLDEAANALSEGASGLDGEDVKLVKSAIEVSEDFAKRASRWLDDLEVSVAAHERVLRWTVRDGKMG